MLCSNCGSKNIQTRKNFSHGSGSKAKKSYLCKDCGSSSVVEEPFRRFNKRR
jgi:transposase-like protein